MINAIKQLWSLLALWSVRCTAAGNPSQKCLLQQTRVTNVEAVQAKEAMPAESTNTTDLQLQDAAAQAQRIGEGVSNLAASLTAASQAQVQLDNEMQGLEEALASAKNAVKTCAHDSVGMESELEASQKAKDRLTREAAELNNKLAKASAAIESSDNLVTGLKSELERTEVSGQALQEQVDQLQAELDKSQELADSASSAAQNLHDRIAAVKSEASKSAAELQSKARALNEAAARAAERAKVARAGIGQAKMELKAVRANYTRLDGEFSAAKISAQKLDSEVTALQDMIHQTEDAADRFASDMKTAISSAHTELDRVTQETAALQTAYDTAKRQTEELRRENDELHKQLVGARKAAKILDAYRQ